MTQTAEPVATASAHRVWIEPNRRRVRVFSGGSAVADSSRTCLEMRGRHAPGHGRTRCYRNELAACVNPGDGTG